MRSEKCYNFQKNHNNNNQTIQVVPTTTAKLFSIENLLSSKTENLEKSSKNSKSDNLTNFGDSRVSSRTLGVKNSNNGTASLKSNKMNAKTNGDITSSSPEKTSRRSSSRRKSSSNSDKNDNKKVNG